jgi:hypothetical protein
VAPEVAPAGSDDASSTTPAAVVEALGAEQPQLVAGTISSDHVAVEPVGIRDEGPSPEPEPVEPDASSPADTAPAEPGPSPTGTDDEAPQAEVTGSAEADAVFPEPVVEAVDEV